MKLRPSSCFFGSILTLILSIVLLVPNARATFYEAVLSNVQSELNVKNIEAMIRRYVARVYVDPWQPTPEDVDSAVQLAAARVCEPRAGREKLTYGDCEILMGKLQRLARDENVIRHLGRELQLIATSYEISVSNPPERVLSLPLSLGSIINMWLPGITNINRKRLSDFLFRIQPVPTDWNVILLDELRNALQFIDYDPVIAEEKRTAAVWRYRDGVRLVRGERAPRFPVPPEIGTTADNGDGTERQYLYKRWPDIEKALMKIWNAILATDWKFNPPLADGEIVYFSFPVHLRDNVILWARVDNSSDENYPWGDIGIDWFIAMEPVMPSLLFGGQPILGGTFPPEPVTLVPASSSSSSSSTSSSSTSSSSSSFSIKPIDGGVLCTHPLSKIGYMCTPASALQNNCEEEIEPVDDFIILTACTEKAERTWCCIAEGEACRPMKSYEACEEVNGLPSGSIEDCIASGCTEPTVEDKRFKERTLAGPDICRNIIWNVAGLAPLNPGTQCKIETDCGCPGFGAEPGFTSMKAGDGTIQVCGRDTIYDLYHELVHATQLCNLPPGSAPYGDGTDEEQNQLCCLREGEAFRAACQMMAQDGLITNVEACAESQTDAVCRSNGYAKGCPLSGGPPFAVPAGGISCNAALAFGEKRIDALLGALKQSDDVCAADMKTVFRNTVGNELCYIGQCLEGSLEIHRLVAGRSPFGIMDESFPWDSQIGEQKAKTMLTTSPPEVRGPIPAYRPRYLLKELDTSLCLRAGLPPRTPPVLCSYTVSRRFTQEPGIRMDTGRSIMEQRHEQQEAILETENILPSIAFRMGSYAYASYIKETLRSFTEVIKRAADMLKTISKISLPGTMCHIGPYNRYFTE